MAFRLIGEGIEGPGFSPLVLDGDDVYHAYSTTARGSSS